MISLKYASIIAVAAFVSGSFVASPELRAFAANTVGSADIINNSILSADIKDGEVKTVDLGNDAVTSAKIKNGEVKTDDIAPSAIGSLRIKDNDVKAQDIATDAVGADEIAKDAVGANELQGVSKLLFVDITINDPAIVLAGDHKSRNISFPGVVISDRIIVTNNSHSCFFAAADAIPGGFFLDLRNTCTSATAYGVGDLSMIIYAQ